jgi:hypothetical protein
MHPIIRTGPASAMTQVKPDPGERLLEPELG